MVLTNHIDELKPYFRIWKRQFIKSNRVIRFISIRLGLKDLLDLGGFDPTKSDWKRVCATKSLFLPNFTEKRVGVIFDDYAFQPLFYTNAMVAIVQKKDWCQSGKCFDDYTLRPQENEWFSLKFIPLTEIREVVIFPKLYSPGFTHMPREGKNLAIALNLPLRIIEVKPDDSLAFSYVLDSCRNIWFWLKCVFATRLNLRLSIPVSTHRIDFFSPLEWDLAYLLDEYNGFNPIEVRYDYNREVIDSKMFHDAIQKEVNFVADNNFSFNPRERNVLREKLAKYLTEILRIYFDF